MGQHKTVVVIFKQVNELNILLEPILFINKFNHYLIIKYRIIRVNTHNGYICLILN